jgi:hypothetical protein
MNIFNKFIFIIFFLFVMIIGQAGAVENTQEKVIAYYFHATARCASCMKIEKWAYEAINKSFPKALKEGELIWKSLDATQPENKHFIEKYQLYSQSLIITKIKNEKEVKWKNLNKVWKFLGNQNKFFDYVTQEVKNYIEKS